MSEKTDVQDVCFRDLYNNHCLVMRINGGMRGNIPFYYWKALYEPSGDDYQHYDKMLRKGISDLIGLFPDGVPFAYETKSDGKPTPEQLLFLREFDRRGGIARVIDNPVQIKPDIEAHC